HGGYGTGWLCSAGAHHGVPAHCLQSPGCELLERPRALRPAALLAGARRVQAPFLLLPPVRRRRAQMHRPAFCRDAGQVLSAPAVAELPPDLRTRLPAETA